jgi:hypothetical protein
MANRHVAIVARGKIADKRVNWGLKRAKNEKLVGTYWTKWHAGNTTEWDGPHKKDEWEAKAAKARKERELRGGITPIAGGVTTKDAIEAMV